MRLDRITLRSGYIASACVGIALYILRFGLPASLGALVACVLLTRLGVYTYFERFLAYKTFEDFRSGRIRHECIACGASCHLRVNLGRDDVERILKYATESGMKETVIEKSGKRFWLKRRSHGACVFLTYQGNLPRCSIYSIRPVACRLFPLIPVGNTLKVDPFCPGLSRERGHTLKEHLTTQEVGSYVRKVIGKV
jgi:Fe-S-cluster containining protein